MGSCSSIPKVSAQQSSLLRLHYICFVLETLRSPVDSILLAMVLILYEVPYSETGIDTVVTHLDVQCRELVLMT